MNMVFSRPPHRILQLGLAISLLAAPAWVHAEDRVDRIERMLEHMQQRVDELSRENQQLKMQMEKNSGEASAAEAVQNTAAEAPPPSIAEESATATPMQSDNAQMDQLNLRIEQLETKQEEIATSVESDVKVGGYATVEYRATNQPNQNSNFRVRHFSLFYSKDVTPEWELFSEMEFEDAPFIESIHTNNTAAQTVQGKFLVEQMYIRYHPELNWDLLAGRFLTPGGIWNVYHYYPFVPTQERPFMVRVLYPQYSDGLQLRNLFQFDSGQLESHIYVANGGGNPGKLDRNVSKAVGGRLNFVPELDINLQFGASLYRDNDNTNTVRTTSGLHLQLHNNDFGIQTEFARRHNAPLNGNSFFDVSAYAQLTYDINKWTVAGRYDWYNVDSLTPLSDRYRYTGALNYHFNHNIVAKIEYNRNRLTTPGLKSYHEVIAAITMAIGGY